MPVSADYSLPVRVNGYSCKNCSEVDTAKRHVDPAHPRSGPDNRDATIDPTRRAADPVRIAAAKKAADDAHRHVIGYSGAGGYRMDRPVAGTGFTIAG